MHEFTLTPGDIDAWIAGDATPVEAALEQLGFDPARRAQALELLAATLAEPTHTAVLDIRQTTGDVQVAVAIGEAVAVAVLERPGATGVRSVVFGPVNDLPRLVADLVDLGPRPHEPDLGPVVIPADVLDAIVGTGLPADELAILHAEFQGTFDPAALDALLGPEAVRWSFTMGPVDDEHPRRVLDVVDADEGGLWVLLPDADPSARLASPVTAATLWLVLTEAVGDRAAVVPQPVAA